MTSLRDWTSARVDLGRAGDSLPTAPLLDFRLAHALARDAVHYSPDIASLANELRQQGWTVASVHSQARNRDEYLRRPDLGRLLDDRSTMILAELPSTRVVFIVADGLSARAVEIHAIPLLESLRNRLGWTAVELCPVIIAEQARVAVSDYIGYGLQAELTLILIGERPGLSTPESLGAYLTWGPQPGKSDAARNCVSNIHKEGLSYDEAAFRLAFLMNEARRRKLSGVDLKETSGRLA